MAVIGVVLAGPNAFAEPQLVNIKTVDPTIIVELRYATDRNVLRRRLYPKNMPALIRPSVAARLRQAQSYLQVRGFRLKIWDAWRPKAAHDQLWEFLPMDDFVANPVNGRGSLHTWGVAVDATMVYSNGHAVTMPTDFDEFTPAAMLRYTGGDRGVREHLLILQRAMARAGFLGMRTEWWHFIAPDWKQYSSIDDLAAAEGSPTPSSSPAPTPGKAASRLQSAPQSPPPPRTGASPAAAIRTR